MKKSPVNSRFPKLILRFSILFAILGMSSGGIFSEESSDASLTLHPAVSHDNTFLIKVKFKDFSVFMPAMFYHEHYVFHAKPSRIKYQPKAPKIMGTGKSSLPMLVEFLETNNSKISKTEAQKIANIYIQESNKEGVNYDVAFSQMCLETGFLRYGGDVRPQQNNFCGLGVTNKGLRGLSFPSVRIGIRAHIQHLKAYASTARLKNPVVDTRLRFVKRGTIKTIDGLNGKWASDKHYSRKIRSLMNRLYEEKRN